MRRTDLSRRIGKAVTTIEDLVLTGREISTKELTEIVKNEVGLKVGKQTKMGTHTVVPFKDSDFEGTLKKTDIYNTDAKAKELGIKDIKNNFGMVQLIHTFNSPTGENKVELKLVVDVDYIDSQDKKHKAYPVLKSLEIPLNENIEEEVAMDEIVEEEVEATVVNDEDIENTEDAQIEDTQAENTTEDTTEDEVEKDYKYYIGEGLTRLFGYRFFGSVPSEDFKKVVVDKLHNIYVSQYLETLFDEESIEDNDSEGIMALMRILNTL